MERTLHQLIAAAIEALLRDHNDFWLLGAMTERGFEDGTRKGTIKEAIPYFKRVGVSDELCSDLCEGMNGNLARIIQGLAPDLHVEYQPSQGRDILIWSDDSDHGAAIDVKHVYDMTKRGYVTGNVPADRDKLLHHRAVRPHDALFQIVWFVQLPCADYPSGRWYGHKDCPSRRHYLVFRDIAAQYAKVAESLGGARWPRSSPPPLVHALSWPTVTVDPQAIRLWFSTVFSPSSNWEFCPESYFRHASVGVALWQY